MADHFQGFRHTIETYRDDTKAFIDWLGNAVAACGYIVHREPLENGKIRDKAKLRQLERYKVSPRILLHQTETVAANPSSIFPADIRGKLKSAIKARRRYYECFQKVCAEGSEANTGHLQFIETLERAQEIMSSLRKSKKKVQIFY